jgi:hypothetical protein
VQGVYKLIIDNEHKFSIKVFYNILIQNNIRVFLMQETIYNKVAPVEKVEKWRLLRLRYCLRPRTNMLHPPFALSPCIAAHPANKNAPYFSPLAASSRFSLLACVKITLMKLLSFSLLHSVP